MNRSACPSQTGCFGLGAANDVKKTRLLGGLGCPIHYREHAANFKVTFTGMSCGMKWPQAQTAHLVGTPLARSADIPVRSDGLCGERATNRPTPAFGSCCGQECPRSDKHVLWLC